MPQRPKAKGVPVDWIGSSKKDLKSFPTKVVHDIGVALQVAQYGGMAPEVKPLKGYGGEVLEIVENSAGATFRAVYTIRFADRIYVLHCFQKKSRKGRRTEKRDIDLIKERLKVAEADDIRRHGKKRGQP